MSSKLNVLVMGQGGREHSIGWAVKKSPRCDELYFSPGNGGTATLGTNIPIPPPIEEHLVGFVKQFNIGLVIIGPDQPLAEGVVDILRAEGIKVVGPTRRAAQLETSKAFAKTLMDDHDIPTAPFQIFDNYARAISYVREQGARPLYIKASGLCAGKGAFPCDTQLDAVIVLRKLMVERTLGNAGSEVVIEDFLDGDELSVHAFCDGVMHVMAPATRDHKKLLESGQTLPDGTNPNTGGMGAFGPVPNITDYRLEIDLIVSRTLHAVKTRLSGEPYTGILYPGCMLTKDGPKVLEFNVRGGDPETQVLMRLLESDALELFEALACEGLINITVEWHQNLYAVCVVLVSGGYPGEYEVGFLISGIEMAELDPRVKVFHAGTKSRDGGFVTAGGRVLNVTATGLTLSGAIEAAYKAVARINFHGMHYRKDIGRDALVSA